MGNAGSDNRYWFEPRVYLPAIALASVAPLLTLLDHSHRLPNFNAIGALGLFVASRAGILPALIISLGAKLASDLLNYREMGFDASYLPSLTIYLLFAVYSLVGWLALKHRYSPIRVTFGAVGSGLIFFLVTNFLAWQHKSLPYSDSIIGLLDSYWMALPFHRGMLLSDLFFSGVLFGIYVAWGYAIAKRSERIAISLW